MPATAADIPPELFEGIINSLQNADVQALRLPRIPRRFDPIVLRCSLVCSYWAEQCRQILYRKKAIKIRSLEDAIVFRNLILETGSARLTPIIHMIDELWMFHDLEKDNRSWSHLLGCLVPLIPAEKFTFFSLSGPIPLALPQRLLCTPHWSIPRPLSSSSTPFREVVLISLRLNSPRDVVRLVNQFAHATTLRLHDLTWDVDEEPIDSLAPRRLPPVQRRLYQSYTFTLSECKINSLLFRHMLRSRFASSSPLQTLSNADRSALGRLLVGISAACNLEDGNSQGRIECTVKFPDVSVDVARTLDIEVIIRSTGVFGAGINLNFVCEVQPHIGPNLTPSQVIGCVVTVPSPLITPLGVEITYASHAFWASLQHFPVLRGLAVGLHDVAACTSNMSDHPDVWQALRGRLKYWQLACWTGGLWEGLDSGSLDKTGIKWNTSKDIIDEMREVLSK